MCSEIRARLYRRLARRKVDPADVATSDLVSEEQKVPTSEPTAASTCSTTEEDRATSITPEALNQMVDELVGYEMTKIIALSQIEDDSVADDLIVCGATINEIYEAVRNETGMPRVDC